MHIISEKVMFSAREYVDRLAGSGRYHFTPAEARQALGGTEDAVRLALYRLMKRGMVARPAQNFYIIVPPEYRQLGSLPADHFIPALMKQLGLDYYAGLLSAAQYYGAAHHRPQEFQVVTGAPRRPLRCGCVKVAFICRKHRLSDVPVLSFNTPHGTIRVSSVEATVIDLVGYPRHAGGLENAATVISELAERIDQRKLINAAGLAPITWVQRLGYLLEKAGRADKAKLLRHYVQKRARDYTPLIPAAQSDVLARDVDWKLDINDNIEAEI
jgi:predicted transcriptional regulator of viral defense system